MEDRGFLEMIHRFLTDKEFRDRWMLTPRETLMAEFGVSRESYAGFMAIVPVLLASGMLVLANGTAPGVTWGGWGRP